MEMQTLVERLKEELESSRNSYILTSRQRDNAWIEVQKLEAKLDANSAELIRMRGCLRLIQQSFKDGVPSEAVVKELSDYIRRILDKGVDNDPQR